MESFDDSIFDNLRLEDLNTKKSHSPQTEVPLANDPSIPSSKQSHSKHKFSSNSNSNQSKHHNKTNEPFKTNSKKSKRLPWNTEILKDRFTPQPFQVQLVDYYLNNLLLDETTSKKASKNTIIFIQNKEWKNYFKIMILKQYLVKLNQIEVSSGQKNHDFDHKHGL